MGNPKEWPQEHVEALRLMIGAASGSYSDIADRMNRQFGTVYTRNSCIGKAQRMGLCKPQQYGPTTQSIMNRRERDRLKKVRRREKLASPKLRLGTPKTSVVYRRNLPKPAEMSKTQLREMLTLAVRNTAAMEDAA